jgi:hypothetical protein
MPTISYFYGITIIMYPRAKEHNPPHIHAITPDCVATFDIRTGELMQGKDFPGKARKMVVTFILKYQEDLLEMWETGVYKRLEPIR